MSVKKPLMTDEEIAKIEELLGSDKDKSVLEWGAGSSTFYYAPFAKEYVSIEHDDHWFRKVHDRIKDDEELSHVRIIHVPIDKNLPRSGKFCSRRKSGNFKSYVLRPRKDDIRDDFDIILVDGRARDWCALEGVHHLKVGGIMLIHDWNEQPGRKHYKRILKSPSMELIDTIGSVGGKRSKSKKGLAILRKVEEIEEDHN
jgi:hypothetical protein